ncbi:MAG TPA: DUF167 domain-containing protein [Vicinamibacterales bacterium]|nr:DUF167 domain-containing protein [Vicinamibacterales bacterium]
MGRVEVRVVPRSPRTAIDGVRDGRVVVRVNAPPVDGAANDAVIAALAEALGVPKRDIRIATGVTSRNKSLEIAGLSREEIARRLGT